MAVFQPLTPIFGALSLPNPQALHFLVQFGAVESRDLSLRYLFYFLG